MKMLRVAVLLMLCGSVSYGIPPSAVADVPCTPVVYLFRHAEDKDAKEQPETILELDGHTYTFSSQLTPAGKQHAELYDDMLGSLGNLFNDSLCPVGKVYTVSPIKPDSTLGTTNPYMTALPLAQQETDAKIPTIKIREKNIGESFGPGGQAELRADYMPILQAGFSVAFFWTSQGLPDLALAINAGFPLEEEGKEWKPPRNSVFMYMPSHLTGSLVPIGVEKPSGEPPDPSTYEPKDGEVSYPSTKWYNRYRQCFNYNPCRTMGGKFSPREGEGLKEERPGEFYCSWSGILTLPSDIDLTQLRGLICDTTFKFHDLRNDSLNCGGEYFGYCTLPYYR